MVVIRQSIRKVIKIWVGRSPDPVNAGYRCTTRRSDVGGAIILGELTAEGQESNTSSATGSLLDLATKEIAYGTFISIPPSGGLVDNYFALNPCRYREVDPLTGGVA